MAEYINKQQILEKAKSLSGSPFGSPLIIAEIEKADGLEVKCGKWSLKYIGVGHYWECSECAFKLSTMPKTKYCPDCGARMDGDT